MKIRMNQQISGLRSTGDKWPAAGDEIVVSDNEGADLCANGYAVPVAEKPKPEKRTVKKKTAAKK